MHLNQTNTPSTQTSMVLPFKGFLQSPAFMLKTLVLGIVLMPLLVLSGCENAELQACKDNASKLWDAKKDNPKDNKAYWDAIERCKEKYG